MRDAGYTLVETLAALAVVSLAMGGLMLGVQVLAPAQLATAKAAARLESLRGAQQRLEGLLARGAPFASSDPSALSGDDHAVRFACGAAAPCRAELSASAGGQQLKVYDGAAPTPVMILTAPADARLAYRSQSKAGAQWPPSGPGAQTLRSIALLASADTAAPALIEARVWPEQTATCAFDPVSGACRG